MRIFKRFKLCQMGLALLVLSLGFKGVVLPTPISAQEDEGYTPHSSEQMVSEVTSVQPGTPFTVAFHFEFDPGWHAYWVNGGDAFLVTTIEWNLPEGFQAGEIQWPIPERYVWAPLVSYIHHDELALLVDLTPLSELNPGSSVRLEALVNWQVCETQCEQAFREFSIEIPVDTRTSEADPRWVELFRESRANQPKVMEAWSVQAEATQSGYRLTVEPSGDGLSFPDSVHFYVAKVDVLDLAATQSAVVEDGRLTLELTGSPLASGPASVLQGVLVAEDGGSWDTEGDVSGLEVEVDVSAEPSGPAAREAAERSAGETSAQAAAPVEGAQGFTIALALVFAFLGGILLNLMPCVFPILSLKVLGAVSQGGEDRIRIRNQGLVFALGVILAFLALGGLLIILRAGGAQLGWGFQLQAPVFVALMAALFFAIGLNLMGLFEVGASLTRVGGRVGEPSGYGESLASGVLATIIATPCTAPFMGAALGFALTRSTFETLLIFGFLGVGMALPYLLLSLAPGLLEHLPRPGQWMETFKQILAFPMFATVIWLVWVFGQQTGVGGGAYLNGGLLLIMGAGWMVGRWQRTDLVSGKVARAVSLAFLAAAALFVIRGSGQEPPLMAVEEGWLPFAQEEVERTLAEGRPVFVDFTAAWCLTCQVNERVVLGTETVQAAFKARNVVLFKADWTRNDPAITRALEAFERSGVPVYVLYAGDPGATPHILPAILTEKIVLDALEEVLSPSQ